MIGATEQTIETVDLNDLMQQVESDLEISIHQKGALVQYRQLPVIHGIAILLYQLFYNLINNALKFSRAGVSPVITISSRTVKVAELENFLALSPETEYAEIVISDNGIGFDQAYAERIFKTFTRLNAKDKYEGTGLGLSLCKKIVLRHHGSISATGMPGEGASFKVVLPVGA
jgi:signal transduction histidine kinase